MTPPIIDPASLYTLATTAGRESLLASWWQQHADGTPDQIQHASPAQRATLLAEWLRWCISEQGLDPRTRLPPYYTLASLFALPSSKQVAPVIGLLRDEGVLPQRHTRTDKGHPQWTERDAYLWRYIGCMRALRFDQAQRLLARESGDEVAGDRLSVSRTSEIIKRWTTAKVAVFRSVFHAHPGWIHLTRRGLRQVALDFRAEVPSIGTLEHLFWITEVRLALEEEHEHMHWISEREIQAAQELRTWGKSVVHIPDGILVLPAPRGQQTHIDIEVQLSRPSRYKVLQVMGDLDYTHSSNPLRYYVSPSARRVVHAALRVLHQREDPSDTPRPSIEIFDLQDLPRLEGLKKT